MDALTRLHKGLLALDTSEDAQHEPLSAPTSLAPADEEPATQALAEDQAPAPDDSASPLGDDREPLPVRNRAAARLADRAERPDAEESDGAAPGPAGEGRHASRTALLQASTVQARDPGPDHDEPEPEPSPEAVSEQETAADQETPAEQEAAEREAADQEVAGQEAAALETAALETTEPEPGSDPAIRAIKETFRYVAEAGDKAVGFFYGQLFVRQPQLRLLFPPAMDEQRDRLFHALGRIVESLSTPEEMAAYLGQLGRDHRKYQVEPEMYEAVGAALLATLRAFAREAFTPEAEEAWTAVYTAGSSLMIKASEEAASRGPASWTAEVVQIDHRSDDIAVLTIAPDQLLPFTAGQHITVQTPRWPRVWRSYSIACMPRDDGLLTLHVKAVSGGWVSTALVRHTQPGGTLTLGPPLGTMTLEPAGGRDLLCIAGGTGLSPVKAIIEQAVRESATTPRRIYLYYGARRREELYDLPDLWRLQDAYHGFQLIPVTSDDPAFDGMQGNIGRVAARYMPHTDCEAYVAGPPEMVRETLRVLARAGLDQQHIHFDDALLASSSRARTST
jgi:NAD(P)H-flavin reductase/hemoglobin-like flavoprotein